MFVWFVCSEALLIGRVAQAEFFSPQWTRVTEEKKNEFVRALDRRVCACQFHSGYCFFSRA